MWFLRRNHFVFVSLRLFVYIHFFIMKKDRKKHVIPKHKNQPYVFILVAMCVCVCEWILIFMCECVCNSNAENEYLYEGMPRILLKKALWLHLCSCVSNWFFSYIFFCNRMIPISFSACVFSHIVCTCVRNSLNIPLYCLHSISIVYCARSSQNKTYILNITLKPPTNNNEWFMVSFVIPGQYLFRSYIEPLLM